MAGHRDAISNFGTMLQFLLSQPFLLASKTTTYTLQDVPGTVADLLSARCKDFRVTPADGQYPLTVSAIGLTASGVCTECQCQATALAFEERRTGVSDT